MSYYAIHTHEDFDVYHNFSNTALNNIYDLCIYYNKPILKYPKRLTTLTLNNVSSIKTLILPPRLINLYINNSMVDEIKFNENIVKMYLNNSRINNNFVNIPPTLKVFSSIKSFFVMSKINDDIEEFIFCDQIPAFMSVVPKNAKRLVLTNLGLQKLPFLYDKLVHLDVQNNNIIEIQQFPSSLESINIANNKLTKLPDLPKKLVNLNISNNYITELPETIIECDKLSNYKAETCNIKYKPSQLKFLYTLIGDLKKFSQKYVGYYTSTETVGLTTTIRHCQQTVENLLKDRISDEMKEKIKYNLDWIKSILAENNCDTKNVTQDWCRKSNFCPEYFKIPIQELWLRIWNRILNSPNKLELINRYIEEMEDARGRCDNGYTIRLLNVLAGFFDDVHIGLNEAEQLAEIIINEQRKTKDNNQLIQNLTEIFIERGISFDKFQEWVGPIIDS
jgi:hypothetical protein